MPHEHCLDMDEIAHLHGKRAKDRFCTLSPLRQAGGTSTLPCDFIHILAMVFTHIVAVP